MRLRNDDELGAVNSEYIGPPGSEWPRVRYVAYVIGATVLFALLVLEHRLGMGLNLIHGLYTIAATVLLTRWIGGHITPETPFRVHPMILWYETNAPRRRTRRATSRLRPAGVRTRAELPDRWWRRA